MVHNYFLKNQKDKYSEYKNKSWRNIFILLDNNNNITLIMKFLQPVSKHLDKYLKDKLLNRNDSLPYLQQTFMSWNKAISFDGNFDNFLRGPSNIHLLQDLWQRSTLQINPFCCQVRLILLNKAFPKIPLSHQFRPITVLSPLFKFQEVRFLPKLQNYMLTRLNPYKLDLYLNHLPNQILQIFQIQITNLRGQINWIVSSLISQMASIAKIDQNLSKYQNKSKYYLQWKQGLQRLGLFNIYLEEVLDIVQQKFKFQYHGFNSQTTLQLYQSTKIQTNFKHARNSIQQIQLDDQQRKCGIFLINNHSPHIKEILHFPIFNQQKYFGITINSNEKLKQHVSNVKLTITLLINNLSWFSHEFNWKHQLQIWKTYIAPHNLYSMNAILTQRYQNIFKQFNQLQKGNYKKMIGFPKNLPNKIKSFINIHNLLKKKGQYKRLLLIPKSHSTNMQVKYHRIYNHQQQNIYQTTLSIYQNNSIYCVKFIICHFSYNHILDYHSKFSLQKIIILLGSKKYNKKKLRKKLENLIQNTTELQIHNI